MRSWINQPFHGAKEE